MSGARALVLLGALSFVACAKPSRTDPAPSAPPSTSAALRPDGASAPGPSSPAPPVARPARFVPTFASPEPLTAGPMPRALDPSIACATPRASGRSLPKGASPLHRALHARCQEALEASSHAGAQADGVSSCTKLASLLFRGHGGPDDAVAAVALDARACALGDLDACGALGGASLTGFGAVFDPACGEAVLTFACDRGGGRACALLGHAELLGDPLPYDPERARATFERGCDGGAYEACLALADRTRPKDPARALALEQRAVKVADEACRRGEGDACVDLVWLYDKEMSGGPFSDAFRASVADAEEAEKYGVLACRSTSRAGCVGRRDVAKNEEAACKEGDFERCIDLSFEHSNASGRGGELDDSDRRALAAACVGGSSRGCWALGDHASLAKLDEACSAGVLGACRPQSRLGEPITRTDSLRKKGCEQGSGIDCRELGEVAIHAGRVSEGVALLTRACPSIRWSREGREIDAIACAEAGHRYRTGDGVDRDPARAEELLLTGCFAEGRLNPRGEGCTELAQMFLTGDGVARDPERARDLLAGACEATRKGCDSFEAVRGEASP